MTTQLIEAESKRAAAEAAFVAAKASGCKLSTVIDLAQTWQSAEAEVSRIGAAK